MIVFAILMTFWFLFATELGKNVFAGLITFVVNCIMYSPIMALISVSLYFIVKGISH